MGSVTLPQRPEAEAATGGRGSECSAVCTLLRARWDGRGGAGLSWAGRAGGRDSDRSPAESHGGTCGRAGLVQTQRFTQPAGKIHFFHLGPFDEAVVLKRKERRREQPGACREE